MVGDAVAGELNQMKWQPERAVCGRMEALRREGRPDGARNSDRQGDRQDWVGSFSSDFLSAEPG